jgi:hypothetical protein
MKVNSLCLLKSNNNNKEKYPVAAVAIEIVKEIVAVVVNLRLPTPHFPLHIETDEMTGREMTIEGEIAIERGRLEDLALTLESERGIVFLRETEKETCVVHYPHLHQPKRSLVVVCLH